MTKTPTSRTVAALKAAGYVPWNVECWVPHAGKRLDFYGIGDTFFLHPLLGALVVQSTTSANKAARAKKVLASSHTRLLLNAGIAVEVWAWKALRGRWAPLIAGFQLDRVKGEVYVVHHDQAPAPEAR